MTFTAKLKNVNQNVKKKVSTKLQNNVQAAAAI